nr:putative AAA-type ATPase family protein [Tanacetum cinerariifolium]
MFPVGQFAEFIEDVEYVNGTQSSFRPIKDGIKHENNDNIEKKVCTSMSSESANMNELLQWNELCDKEGSRKKKLLSLHVENVLMVFHGFDS